MDTTSKMSLSRIQTVTHTLAILAMMVGLFGFLGYLILGMTGLFLAFALCIVFLTTTPRIAPGF